MLSIVLAGLIFSPFANSSGVAEYASIRGTVTTGWPNFKPVANAQVIVTGDTDLRVTRTDSNGRYTFLTLLPGTYHVYVPSYRGLVAMGSLERPVSHQCLENANAPVELSAGLAYFANIDLLTRCS